MAVRCSGRAAYPFPGLGERIETIDVEHGDGLADLKPIAHLYKTQVYALAAFLGAKAEEVVFTSGGSEAKPVGTVFIGLASALKTEVVQRFNPQEREMFKYVTTQQALELLRRLLILSYE